MSGQLGAPGETRLSDSWWFQTHKVWCNPVMPGLTKEVLGTTPNYQVKGTKTFDWSSRLADRLTLPIAREISGVKAKALHLLRKG